MYYRSYLPTLAIDRALRNDCSDKTCHPAAFGHRLRAELRELGEGWEIQLELPGLGKEDLEISLDKDELVIGGTFVRKDLGEQDKVLHSTRFQGKFERRFRLSEEVSREGIQASMQHGVLTVRLQKVEKALPTRIEIQG